MQPQATYAVFDMHASASALSGRNQLPAPYRTLQMCQLRPESLASF